MKLSNVETTNVVPVHRRGEKERERERERGEREGERGGETLSEGVLGLLMGYRYSRERVKSV